MQERERMFLSQTHGFLLTALRFRLRSLKVVSASDRVLSSVASNAMWPLSAGRIGRRLLARLGATPFQITGFVRIFRESLPALGAPGEPRPNKRCTDGVVYDRGSAVFLRMVRLSRSSEG